MFDTFVPTAFHLGQAGLLGSLAVLALARTRAKGPRRPSLVLQIGLAGAVVVWAAMSLGVVARDHAPGLEVEGYELSPPASGAGAISLGTGEAADVPLADPYADAVHAVVQWRDGASGPEPWIWNASAERKIEIDGRNMHEVVLEPGTRIQLGDDVAVVEESGRWPGLVLRKSDDSVIRLDAPAARGLLAMTPRMGRKIRSRLGAVTADADGLTSVEPGRPPLPGSGPVAYVVLRGTKPVLTFAGAGDRADHELRVQGPDDAAPYRPADRWTRLEDGQTLALGYSRFAVSVERNGTVGLRSVGNPAREPWPGDEAVVLGTGAGLLAVGDEDGASLALASLEPDRSRGFRRIDGVFVEAESGPSRVSVAAGEQFELPVADGARMTMRVAGRGTPMVALSGAAASSDQDAWRVFALLALLYLLATVALTRSGLLHARSAGVVHGAAMLFAIGLLCLYRLSDPGDPRRAAWVLRQAWLGVYGLGATTVLAAFLGWRARFSRPIPARLFGWLDGGRGAGSRARWLYVLAVAVLALQLPFGEAGIAVIGLGSVQPIEIARTLLVIYLAYWTARAVEDKRDRLRGKEGLAQRWSYMVHALPVLAVLGLCYGLHDISPILVFVAFMGVLYLSSVLRPSVRLWPPRAWRDSIAVELLVIGLALAGVAWIVLADPNGTVATRIRTWWDPWSHSSEAYQAMTALWTTASGGLFGLGWTGENGVLPPAVKDDFILALLAARGGVAAVTGVAATFGVILLSGASALSHPHLISGGRGDRERVTMMASAALWMLAIQAAVVLGSATGGLPVMGQPLPLVAAAGSHLLFFCFPALGLVLAATRVKVPVPARPPRGVRTRPVRPGWDIEGISAHPITEGG